MDFILQLNGYVKRLIQPVSFSLSKQLNLILVFALWLATFIFIPDLSLLLIMVNGAILIFISALRLYTVSLPEKKIPTIKTNHSPFVSIHIPIYNEPPYIVKDTLKALAQLDYPNYEVIVLDNNTKDENVWRPVEELCKELGDKFKFYHIDNLKGYKAGALNVCLQKMDTQTEYILVIDADYQVTPDLLKVGLSYFYNDKIALVQFPQAYMNTGQENDALTEEYNHFFKVYMNAANRMDSVLSTGTVALVRKKALYDIGKWQGQTITEDAELGIRLHEAGYSGVYVPKALGKGLMPTDVKALRTQRERWVYGNMQTLVLFLKRAGSCFTSKKCIGIIAQLTAWFSFTFIPVLSLVLTGLLYPLVTSNQRIYTDIAALSGITILLSLILRLIFFLIAFRNEKYGINKAWRSFLVHIGLAWEGGVSWLTSLLGTRLGFKRTNKFPTMENFIALMPNLLLSILLAISGIIWLVYGHELLGGISLLSASIYASILYVKKQLHATALLTS